MATVYTRERSSVYYAKWPNKDGGPPIRRSTGLKVKKEAQRLADKWEREYLAAFHLGASDEKTLSQVFEMYLKTVKGDEAKHDRQSIRSRSVIGDGDAFEGQFKLDGDLVFHKLTSLMLDEYQQERLKAGYSKSTINQDIQVISNAFRTAKKNKIRVNLELEFPRFKIESHSRHMDDDEVRDLLRYMDPDRPLIGRGGKGYQPQALGMDPKIKRQRQQNYDLVIMGLDCGARLSELTKLTWAMIDVGDTWSFTIDRRKTKDRRTVNDNGILDVTPTKRVKAILKRRYEERETGINFVFSGWTRVGPKLVRKNVPQQNTRAVTKAMNAVGINSPEKVAVYGKRTFKHVRDTYATRLGDAGVDLADIQDMLGHASPTMTRKYRATRLASKSAQMADILGT